MTLQTTPAVLPSSVSNAAPFAWLEAWRTVWFDLPLAWLIEVECATLAIAAGGLGTPLQAVAAGLGCNRPLAAD